MKKANETGIDYAQLLKARKYDPKSKPGEEQILFTIQGKHIGSAENYIVFSGLPKVGKSTFISALIGSFILPDFQDVWGMKLKPVAGRGRLAYFDTESSQFDFYRQVERIKAFGLRENLPRNIDCFNTREDSPGTIRRMIETYLKAKTDCIILIIDGFLDLCLNYNDEVETRLLTNWLKRLTKEYKILLVGVLHLGKGGNETLGHLGSNTDRWAQSTLLIEKNKNTKQFILKPKFLRSALDFDPIALVNYEGKWSQVPYEHEEPEIKKGRKT